MNTYNDFAAAAVKIYDQLDGPLLDAAIDAFTELDAVRTPAMINLLHRKGIDVRAIDRLFQAIVEDFSGHSKKDARPWAR